MIFIGIWFYFLLIKATSTHFFFFIWPVITNQSIKITLIYPISQQLINYNLSQQKETKKFRKKIKISLIQKRKGTWNCFENSFLRRALIKLILLRCRRRRRFIVRAIQFLSPFPKVNVPSPDNRPVTSAAPSLRSRNSKAPQRFNRMDIPVSLQRPPRLRYENGTQYRPARHLWSFSFFPINSYFLASFIYLGSEH